MKMEREEKKTHTLIYALNPADQVQRYLLGL